ncbi:MAG: DUF1566 domain-containing protein [Pseudomonadales bacterium]|nr:DUF1566 domain-containing protein [Pseudomonadales bacterium]
MRLVESGWSWRERFFCTLVLLLMMLSAGCQYEPVEVEENDDDGLEQDVESNQDVTTNVVFPRLPLCDGDCSCDNVVMKLNDTGIIASGELSKGNDTYCSSSSETTQDCHHGRDSDDSLNKMGAGRAGFDFSKIDVAGNLLANDASEWRCVLDNHTGMMWEVKTNELSDDIGHKKHTFSWYNPNMLDYSTPDNGNCNLAQGCDTDAYIQAVNTHSLCGFSDWRLPDKVELQDLVDYGHPFPSIDASHFPHTSPGFYWTSNIDIDDINSVWVVDFYYGHVAGSSSDEARYIRLVREHSAQGKPVLVSNQTEKNISLRRKLAPKQHCNSRAILTAPIARFKQDAQGNVFDTFTGLIWRRCVAGLSGDLCNNGQPLYLTWKAALEYSSNESLGLSAATTAWRIPNIKELQQTIEIQCEQPALNPFVFPNIPLSHVWSSTPNITHDERSYYYQYQNSLIFHGNREALHLVHMVRDCKNNGG